MADTPISGLPAASAANGTDQFPANQSGTTRRVTAAQILAYVQSALSSVFAAASSLTAHTGNTSNPHSVTAAQVGAVPTGRTITINGTGYDLSANRTWTLSGGAVDSVNGQTGAVVLTASDVGAAATSHTQAQSTITGLVSALAAKADATHTHSISDVTGLQTALDAKRLPPLALYWSADGAIYFVAHEAMTLTTATEAGTGTVAWARALAASPGTFSSASFPLSLAAGDVLRATLSDISGYKAATLPRTA